MTVRTNTAEGGSDGVDVDTSNSGGVNGTAWDSVTPGAGGTIRFTTDMAMKGSLSYEMIAASGVQQQMYWAFTSTTAQAARAYFYFTDWANTQDQFFFTFLSSTGTARARLAMDNAGILSVFDAAGIEQGATTGAIPVDTWLRIEMAVTTPTTSTGTYTLRVYNGDSLSSISNLDLDLTGENFGASVGRLGIGKQTTASLFPTFYVDDIAHNDASATLLGPSGLALAQTVTRVAQVATIT